MPIYNITAEVVFVLDASTQAGEDNFDKQKAFVKLLARSLNVSPGKSTAVVITYSTSPYTDIPLGSYSTVQEFERSLDNIPFFGGSRRMDRALEEAVSLFQNASTGVDRKIILITAGRQTPGEDEQPLDKFKRLLLNVGALPFIVAVGKDHDNPTLATAVEDSEDIIRVPSFVELLSYVSSTSARVANRTG